MICYRVTHLESGKAYIGSTTRTLRQRRWEHQRAKTAIGAAIRKYGIEAFSMEVICCAKSHEDLLALETALIRQEQTEAPLGYNVASDGRGAMYGRHHSEETKQKIRAAQAGEKANNYGKPIPQETKNRISVILSEQRRGSGNPMFGRKLTPEQSAARSRIFSGPGNPNFGKKASDETRKKQSISHLGRSPSEAHRQKIAAALRAFHARKRAGGAHG